jgi:hypothetical protein
MYVAVLRSDILPLSWFMAYHATSIVGLIETRKPVASITFPTSATHRLRWETYVLRLLKPRRRTALRFRLEMLEGTQFLHLWIVGRG